MLNKLKLIEQELEKINESLMSQDIVSDQKKYIQLSKKAASLRPIVELLHIYEKYLKQKDEALELMKDPEMKELASLELEEAKEMIPKIEEELKVVLLPKDPNDDRDVIVEIRPAAGWDEASIFAWQLLRMYTRYAENNWYIVDIISVQRVEPDWVKYATFKVIWTWAYSKYKYESWVHRVQRVPLTETQWRVHTSTATVAVMPEVDDIEEVEVKTEDIRIDTFRSQGAWGQHVNVTDSAVRITHIPTWLVVECQDWRSQHANRQSAMTVLKSRLYSAEIEKAQKEQKDLRLSQVWTWDRSEKIRTYNFPQDRLTDHRIKASWSNLPSIMDWNINDVFEKVLLEDQARKMAGSKD